jgi:asparagine synthase (glutamine-hydrolysing)
MCGICGFIRPSTGHDVATRLLEQMSAMLAHRGPDDAGTWAHGDVGLATRRLSILDLTPAGHQPMQSDDGQLIVAFNGEIYNFQSIRASLEAKGRRFRSQSDTECLLHLYAVYGDDMLAHLHGMFAFALWDNARHRLLVARDRLGKKPLYYFAGNGAFAFASEIKSLLEFPLLSRQLDWEAVDDFFHRRWITGPRTVFRDIRKLLPGHYLIFDRDKPLADRCYWSPPKPSMQTPALSTDELDELLQTSVRLRLVSDVPVGAFLSGGVDSSLIVALMSRVGGNQIKTFSIGFAETGGFDEARFSRLISEQFGTQHHAHTFTAEDLLREIQTAVYHLDEPLADAACVPTLLLSRAAASEVKVVLSGEGADELFAGYTRHHREQFFAWAQSLPFYPLGKKLAELSRRLPLSRRQRKALLLLTQEPTARVDSYHGVFDTTERMELFEPLSQLQRRPVARIDLSEFPSSLDWLLWEDMRTWLPDDLLMKVDKMSMAVSLEVRAPYLDHVLVERVLPIPAQEKINRQQNKILLRRLAKRYLPESIVNRPKHGFDVPLDAWLRTKLKSFAQEVLFDEQLGSLAPDQRVVRRYWDEHQDGRDNHGLKLWALICWKLWCASYRPHE